MLNGLNLYAYCRNNPIAYFDIFGNYSILNLKKLNNIVNRYSYTKNLIDINTLAFLLGNIYFTITIQDGKNTLFYSYTEYEKNSIGYGVGMNIKDMIGFEIGVTTGGLQDYSLNTGLSLGTINFGGSIGLSGIGISFGVTINNTTYTIGGNIGWGTIALASAIATLPIPGTRIISALALLIDWIF